MHVSKINKYCTPPFLISRIYNYCNLAGVEQCCHLVLNSWHNVSVVTPNDTNSVKQLHYFLEKKTGVCL